MSILPSLPRLLDKGAEYRLKQFSLKIPEGNIDADGRVAVLKPNEANQSANMFALLYRLDAHFNIQLPQSLAKRLVDQVYVRKLMKQAAKQLAAYRKAKQEGRGELEAAPVLLTKQQILSKSQATTQQQLALWINKGFLHKEGDRYRVNFTFKQGKLTINGKPFMSNSVAAPHAS